MERNEHSPAEHNTPGADPEMDAQYDAFLPTLTAARRSYTRKRLAGFLVLPLLIGIGVAWAQQDGSAGAELVATEPEAPEPEPTVTPMPTEQPVAVEPTVTPQEELVEPVELVTMDLGLAGSASVEVDGEALTIVEFNLNEGWEAQVVELGGSSSVAIVLTNGEVKLLARLNADLETEIDDISPPPEPEVETRKEIVVAGQGNIGEVGKVVVEREGDKLFMAVLWSHEWYDAKIVTEAGPRVYAYFTNDGVKHHVEAWIEGAEIVHGVWVTEPEDKKNAEGKDEDKNKTGDDEKKKSDKTDEEPEVQTRKEIHVGEVGKVVVERDGEKLYLGVVWNHEWYDPVVVSPKGAKVHAYFTNDGVEHHVRAWIKGTKIKHETWVVEPEVAAYDGTVSCGFGTVGVLVEGNVARVMSVQEVEGVEAKILTEVGEVVRVRFTTEDAVWVLEAWGNGEEVLSECGQSE